MMPSSEFLPIGLLTALIFLFIDKISSKQNQLSPHGKTTDILGVSYKWTMTCASLMLIGFMLKKTEDFSRVVLTLWAIITPLLLVFVDLLLRRMSHIFWLKSNAQMDVVIFGAGELGQKLQKNILQHHKEYNIIGLFDDDINADGTIEEGIATVRSGSLGKVFLALPLKHGGKIADIVETLTDSSASLEYVPDILGHELINASIRSIGDLAVISLQTTPITGLDLATKRLEDLIVSAIAIVVFSPIIALISIAIKLTSKGPVIFQQRRCGINGKEVTVWKFRTMTVIEDGDLVKLATRDDDRITNLGKFLRRTSLDELPQFFNVLLGSMSIVGPRPHALAINAQYRDQAPKYMRRHLVKPGITGWAQVNGFRGETDTIDKILKRTEYDLYYIKNWSISMDLKIIIMTIYKGFINTQP